MLPVIALVGRPNVGKSTLFNCLTRSRDALVADVPGLTRDRQYGRGRVGDIPYLVVDTGGLGGEGEGVEALMARQTQHAIAESDVIFFLVDGREGPGTTDQAIAENLRRQGKPIYLVVNKVDGIDAETAAAQFFELAVGQPHPISAAQGQGVRGLMGRVLAELSETAKAPEAPPGEVVPETRVAVIGRPNVGKSTLVNRLLGEERVLAYDMPGTTRDTIFIPFEHGGKRYTLIDTAGLRRRARIREAIEKFSVIKAMQAIEACHVAVVVLDARQGIAEQDATILGHVLEAGRALIVAVNKWDGLRPEQREHVRRELERRLSFVDFAEVHFISALHGTGIGHLLEAVDRAYGSATRELATPELTRILQDAVTAHPPPLVRGRRIKLRYAHQGGRTPPLIVVHGTRTESVPNAYRRYLVNVFRESLGLAGTPVRVEFRGGANSYSAGRNSSTRRRPERPKRAVHRRR
ncbi:MAG: ribosome biogenesis GTPase Der [Gammaproteobacteria bacterium]|nr:ribosome biogenesis GTPase Der [Gammaproteobacteria bacterium]NIR97900.1 ribosome biogenesis GTPase Der [Gammaproteobacteria bacterium]NIT63605.1 ribosome biogenesis GTPase Der [Gammaproteobacteria bacterium]NIV20541.1 ribosome biogenesis GTPase Der [Gammaproteobacteria bacterium]NIX11135.1 ribosome biogenesis GTPase Der [Gammaproteobacteria bacterium]